MTDKKLFNYSGKMGHTPASGSFHAVDKAAAELMAKKMGLTNVEVTDPLDPKPQLPASESPVKQMIGEVPAKAPETIVPVVPKIVDDMRRKQEENVTSMIKGMSKAVEKQIEAMADTANMNVRRRQSLVVGEVATVETRLRPLLEQGGKVMHIVMQNNPQGHLILAVVVEHEEKLNEK